MRIVWTLKKGEPQIGTDGKLRRSQGPVVGIQRSGKRKKPDLSGATGGWSTRVCDGGSGSVSLRTSGVKRFSRDAGTRPSQCGKDSSGNSLTYRKTRASCGSAAPVHG